MNSKSKSVNDKWYLGNDKSCDKLRKVTLGVIFSGTFFFAQLKYKNKIKKQYKCPIIYLEVNLLRLLAQLDFSTRRFHNLFYCCTTLSNYKPGGRIGDDNFHLNFLI